MAAKVWNETKQRRLVKMYEANEYSTREMARELGVTQRTIYNQFFRLGWKSKQLPHRLNPPGKVSFTENEDGLIRNLKTQGIFCTMIAEKLGKPRWAVGRRIKELGLVNSNLLPLPVGKRYTALVVLADAEPGRNAKTGHKTARSLLRCDCGKEVTVHNHALRVGNTRSCGCKIQSKNPDTPTIRVFYQYKNGADSRNLRFELTLAQVSGICAMPCQYCGSEPSNKQKGRSTGRSNGEVTLQYTGIDQISPCGGYYLGNVVPCCYMCNRAKSNMSLREFIGWLNLIGSHIKEESVIASAIRLKAELSPQEAIEIVDTRSFRKTLALKRTNPEQLKEWKRTSQLIS